VLPSFDVTVRSTSGFCDRYSSSICTCPEATILCNVLVCTSDWITDDNDDKDDEIDEVGDDSTLDELFSLGPVKTNKI
jgi:hypothetical protein